MEPQLLGALRTARPEIWARTAGSIAYQPCSGVSLAPIAEPKPFNAATSSDLQKHEANPDLE